MFSLFFVFGRFLSSAAFGCGAFHQSRMAENPTVGWKSYLSDCKQSPGLIYRVSDAEQVSMSVWLFIHPMMNTPL